MSPARAQRRSRRAPRSPRYDSAALSPAGEGGAPPRAQTRTHQRYTAGRPLLRAAPVWRAAARAGGLGRPALAPRSAGGRSGRGGWSVGAHEQARTRQPGVLESESNCSVTHNHTHANRGRGRGGGGQRERKRDRVRVSHGDVRTVARRLRFLTAAAHPLAPCRCAPATLSSVTDHCYDGRKPARDGGKAACTETATCGVSTQ